MGVFKYIVKFAETQSSTEKNTDMDNFSFYTPTRYKFGRGTENLVGEMSASQGWETVMIVYGGGSAIRSGLLERVCKSLTRAGVKFVTFGGSSPTPQTAPSARP